MSLKNIGSAISATGGITQFLSILQGLGGFSFGNMMQLTRVIGVFKEMKQMTEGMTALKTVSTLMKSFDGSEAAMKGIASALSGLKMETATAVLGMTNLNKEQLAFILNAAGVDAALASETASTIASGAAATGASVGFKALGASILSAAKAVLVFLATNPVGWLITAGVALLVWTKHVENHNKAMREASQAADEYATSTKEAYEKEVDETKSLNDLIDKYKELKRQYEAGGELDSGLRQQILDVQSQITDMVGSQAENLDLVNGKLDEELGKLGEIAKEQAKQEKESANAAYKAAVDASEKAVSIGLKGQSLAFKDKEIYDYVGKITQAERDAFYESGYNALFENWGNGKFGLNFDSDFAKGLADTFDFDISTAEGRVEAISSMMAKLEEAMPDSYFDSDLYAGLQVAKEHYQGYVDAVADSAKSLIDATVKQQYYSDALDKSAVKDAQSLETYRKTWIDLVKNDDMIKQRLADGVISESDVEEQVDYYISTLSGLSDFYIDWMNQFDEATVERNDKVKEAFSLTKEADALTEWYESLPEGDKELVYSIVLSNTDEERQKTIDALAKMSEGGSVDLNLRPVIDTKILKDAGWKDAGEGAATVFTSTFANQAAENNEDGGIAMNFTPIITDENGDFVGVLTPEELEDYATEVINEYERTGILKDDKGLKIGATFDGKDAISKASAVAESIHDAQAKIYTTPEAENMSVDSYVEALEGVKEETVNAATIVSESWKGTLEDFDTLWGDDSQFKEGVDDYTEQLDTLKEAIDKFDKGELDTADIITLRTQFSALSKYSNKDLDKGLKKVYKDLLGVGDATKKDTGLVGLFNKQIRELETQSPDTANALSQIRDEYLNLYDLDGSVQLDPFVNMGEAVEKISQMRQYLTSGALTKENMDDIFKNHPEFIQFLQNSAAGMTLDTQKANELLKAQGELNLEIADANKYAAELSYQKNLKEMEELAGGAKELQDILAAGYSDDFARIFELAGENEGLENAIRQWEEYSAEIRQTLSLLQQYNDAQSSANASDAFMAVRSGLKGADEKYEQGLITQDDFTSYAMLLAKNGATIEEAVMSYAENRERFKNYLETDTVAEGLNNFWSDAAQKSSELGESWVKLNEETGTFEFDIQDMNAFADAMGINTEMAEYFFLALKDIGYMDLDLSMIGDSFKESVENLDLKSDTAVENLDHLIDRMGRLEQEGVDCSDSIPNIVNAIQTLADSGANVQPLIDKLHELGYELEIDEETKEITIKGEVDVDKSEIEQTKSEVESNPIIQKIKTQFEDTVSNVKDKIKSFFGGGGGEETPTSTPTTQDVTVNVTQEPDPLEINTKVDPVEITQDGETKVTTEDGVTVEITQDGVTDVTTEDGVSVAITQDGVTKVTPEEGVTVEITQDGITVVTPEDNVTVPINQEGTTEVTCGDATVVVTQDGTTDVTCNDAKVTVKPDKESYNVTINGQEVVVTPVINPETGALSVAVNGTPGDVTEATATMQAELDSKPLKQKVVGYYASEDTETPEIEAQEQEIDVHGTAVIDEVDTSNLPNETAVEMEGEVSDVEVSETAVDPIELEADKSQVDETVAETESEVSGLDNETGTPKIDGDDSQYQATDSDVHSKLGQLDSDSAEPTVSLDDQASSGISNIASGIASLPDSKTITITTVHQSSGGGEFSGGGHDFANGTVNAFSRGTNVAIGNNQTALLNELGEESIARNGRYYTVSGGAQFVKLKKGDIIFNHKQTEELQKYGKVTSGGGHGRLALSKGTVNAFYNSTATGGKNVIVVDTNKNKGSSSSGTGSTGTGTSTSTGTKKSSNSDSDDKKSKSTQSEFQKWFSGLFDWAEVRLKRLNRLTEKWTDKAEKAVRYSYNAVTDNKTISNQYDKKEKYTRKAITATENEITGQKKAKNTYTNELKKIKKKGGLSNKTIQKIINQTKNGNFSIESFNSDNEKDKKTKEAITAYQTYYEKVLACKDSVDDLKESQLDLYEQLYNIPIDKANAKLEKYENTLSRISAISSAVSGGVKQYLNQTVSDAGINVSEAESSLTKAKNTQDSAQAKVDNLKKKVKNTKDKKKKKEYKKQLKSAKSNLKSAKTSMKAAQAEVKAAKADYKQATKTYDKYINQPDYVYQNYLLDQDTKTKGQENTAAQEAARTAQTNLTKAQTSRATAEKNVSNKSADILKKYKKNLSASQKADLKAGKTVSTKGINDKNTLKAIKAYNNLVKTASKASTGLTAAEEALSNANQLATEKQAEYTEAIQENAKAKFDNIQTSFENQQSLISATLQKQQSQQTMYAQTGVSQIGQAQRDILNSELASNMSLLQSQQAELSALRQSYDENQENMSEADKLAAQEQMESLQGTIYNTTGTIADLRDEISNIEITRLSIDLGKLKANAEKLQDEIDFNNTKGIRTTANDYKKLIDNSQGQVAVLQQENAEYLKQQQNYEVGSQKYQELQEKIDDNNDAIRDARKSQEEWNNAIANLPYETVEQYLELLDAVAENRKSMLDLKSDKGIDLTESDYLNQMKDNTNKIEQYTKERQQAFADYQKAMASSEGVYGGKTIEEWKAEYLGFDTQINKLLADNEELKDSLRDDVYWRDLERAHNASQRLQTVLNGIAELISDDMIYDKNGLLTNWGNARIASLIKQYETIRDEMSIYSKDVENLNKLYKSGYYTELEYEEKLGEIQQTLLESASSMKQYMDTIIDMYKEMAQSELDNLNKLIDKRNQALQAKKDYYDFDKTLKNKNSELQSLKAQRDALEGIAGAEAKAKRAKLDADIEEAQEEMDEILMEHQFDLSSEALSDLKETMQEAFDDRWETVHQDFGAIQDILKSANNLVTSSATAITNQLDQLLHFYGINGASGIASSVITGYSSGTKRVTKDEVARIGEKGDEIYSKNGQLYTTFESGDFVIPNRFSSNLYDWGSFSPNEYYNKVMSGMKPVGETNSSVVNNNQHYDSLVTIEGDVTREVFPGVERMCKEAYRYMVREATIDAKHAGIKVR